MGLGGDVVGGGERAVRLGHLGELRAQDPAGRVSRGDGLPEGQPGLCGVGALAHRFGTYQHHDGGRVVCARSSPGPGGHRNRPVNAAPFQSRGREGSPAGGGSTGCLWPAGWESELARLRRQMPWLGFFFDGRHWWGVYGRLMIKRVTVSKRRSCASMMFGGQADAEAQQRGPRRRVHRSAYPAPAQYSAQTVQERGQHQQIQQREHSMADREQHKHRDTRVGAKELR